MDSREFPPIESWDDKELQRLVTRFVRLFHRLPSHDELAWFRRLPKKCVLRVPAQSSRA